MTSPRDLLGVWPVARQLTGDDRLGRGAAARSKGSRETVARTRTADRVVKSVCPYCAVGCAQNVFVSDERVIQIEGDPDAPHSRGRLCPKGSATKQLVTSPSRVTTVRYRRPFGTEWEDLDLDTALDMIADRVIATRRATWEDHDEQGRQLRRTMGIASLGGATLDN
ncbi:MAG: formate dehydrogenase, partial [Solirubrobacteraceae bacterium]